MNTSVISLVEVRGAEELNFFSPRNFITDIKKVTFKTNPKWIIRR